MIKREQLEEAALNYDSSKYPEEFYRYHLQVLRDASGASDAVADAVRCLFLWKLNKVHTHRTSTGSLLPFRDSGGNAYYGAGTTRDNAKAIARALQTDNLAAGLSFRDGSSSYEYFKPHAETLTRTSIVLPSFYVHMWRPDDYQILDKNVWMIFSKEAGRRVRKSTKPKTWEDYEAYTAFFRKLIRDTGLHWRTIDKGLMILGDLLIKQASRCKKETHVTTHATPRIHRPVQKTLKNEALPSDLATRAFAAIQQRIAQLPFRWRGIAITYELVGAAIAILNAEPSKTLPQNCRNDIRSRTPDGLDRRIKEKLNTDLRTANIISDVLEKADIVEVIVLSIPRPADLSKERGSFKTGPGGLTERCKEEIYERHPNRSRTCRTHSDSLDRALIKSRKEGNSSLCASYSAIR